MLSFRNNNDVSAFIEELVEFLRSTQEVDLADQLSRANRFISVSASEHLNEVYLELKRVLSFRPKALSAEREDEILQAIRYIDGTFGVADGA